MTFAHYGTLFVFAAFSAIFVWLDNIRPSRHEEEEFCSSMDMRSPRRDEPIQRPWIGRTSAASGEPSAASGEPSAAIGEPSAVSAPPENHVSEGSRAPLSPVEHNIIVCGPKSSGKSTLVQELTKVLTTMEGFNEIPPRQGEPSDAAEERVFDRDYSFRLLEDDSGNVPRGMLRRNIQLESFDTVILVYSGSLTSNIVEIAQQAHDLMKNIIFVRSKIDFDVFSSQRSILNLSREEAHSAIKQEAREDFEYGTGTLLRACPFFIVSGWNFFDDTLDGRRLVEELLELLESENAT
ncbi:hypothetical protein BSKO_02552 [Bryopsis sp. KO-2023]|nr:hypothetical protein BSKO_02552 [Bryopsis sp. KO-2023]